MTKKLPEEYQFGKDRHPTPDMLDAYISDSSEIQEARRDGIATHLLACDECWKKFEKLDQEKHRKK